MLFLDALTAALSRTGSGYGELADNGNGHAITAPEAEAAHRCVLIHDGVTPSSWGSRSVVRHLLLRCLQSPSVSRVVVLSLIFPSEHYQRMVEHAAATAQSSASTLRGVDAAARQKLTVIDAVSALSLSLEGNDGQATAPIHDRPYAQRTCATLALPELFAVVQEAIASAASAVFLVDGLSPLLLQHSASAVLPWLLTLRALPAVSLVIHADSAVPAVLSLSPHALAALDRVAQSVVRLTDARQEALLTAQSTFRYHLTADCKRTRRTGQVQSVVEQWALEPNAALLSASKAAAPEAARADAATAALRALLSTSTATATAAPSFAPVSSFNLSTSEKQRRAKAQLHLPYQHTGAPPADAVTFGASGLQLSNGTAHDGDDASDDDDEDADDDLDM